MSELTQQQQQRRHRYRSHIDNMTTEQRIAHREYDRLRMRQRRLNMSDEQRLVSRERDRCQRIERWQRLTDEQRTLYRQHKRNQARERRAVNQSRGTNALTEQSQASIQHEIALSEFERVIASSDCPLPFNTITVDTTDPPTAAIASPTVLIIDCPFSSNVTRTVEQTEPARDTTTLTTNDTIEDPFLTVIQQHLQSEVLKLTGHSTGASLDINTNTNANTNTLQVTLASSSEAHMELNVEEDLNVIHDIHDEICSDNEPHNSLINSTIDSPSTFSHDTQGTSTNLNFQDNVIDHDPLNIAMPQTESPDALLNGVIDSPTTLNRHGQEIPEQVLHRGTATSNRHRAYHNCVRNYIDSSILQPFELPNARSCRHYARLFAHETEELCHLNGQVSLPVPPIPQDLLNLFTTSSIEGVHFIENIHSYNHVHSFTSIGVHIDENLASGRNGVYTYRAQGSIYHRIGDLLPKAGKRPRYLQMYVYDTDHELDNWLAENNSLNRQVLAILKRTLDSCNPFVGILRQIAQRDDLHNVRLHIKDHPNDLHQYSQPTTSHVAAILVGAEDPFDINERDIIIETGHGRSLHVPDTAGFYDPLQYPLIFPYETFGWDLNVFGGNLSRVSCRAFYSYMLQIRDTYESLLLCARRLLQQYVVNNYVKISTQQLRYLRDHQDDIRADLYQGLQDSFNIGQTDTGNIGRRIVLPASYTGSPRDMHERYQDAMAIAQKFDHSDKLRSPEHYDQVVRVEILDPLLEPELHKIVLRHMIHGPCGALNPTCVCMKNNKCKKSFPKPFSSSTLQGDDSYPIYMRRNINQYLIHNIKGDFHVNDGFVVPYNPWLLKKYDCHINVEICSSIKSVKYLYKYVYKGVDRVSLQVSLSGAANEDEINQFVDGRWICPQEAVWRIFKFPLNRMYPSVYDLQIHLKNMHQVTFRAGQHVNELLTDSSTSRSMLTEFFKLNSVDQQARQYLYREIPEHYTWIKLGKFWQTRRGHNRVIGRIHIVSPSDSEKYYLKVLLNHVRGPTSYESLQTVDGHICSTFKEAVEKLGILEGGNDIHEILKEVVAMCMPHALRKLFVMILVHCNPPHVCNLWDKFHTYMLEDYTLSSSTEEATNHLLKDISSALSEHI